MENAELEGRTCVVWLKGLNNTGPQHHTVTTTFTIVTATVHMCAPTHPQLRSRRLEFHHQGHFFSIYHFFIYSCSRAYVDAFDKYLLKLLQRAKPWANHRNE